MELILQVLQVRCEWRGPRAGCAGARYIGGLSCETQHILDRVSILRKDGVVAWALCQSWRIGRLRIAKPLSYRFISNRVRAESFHEPCASTTYRSMGPILWHKLSGVKFGVLWCFASGFLSFSEWACGERKGRFTFNVQDLL